MIDRVRSPRRRQTRLVSADNRSEFRVALTFSVVVGLALYAFLALLGLPGWVGAVAVAVVAVPRLRRGRGHLLVDDEQVVSVEGGKRAEPIWWDTVDAMFVDRRRPPWVVRATARGDVRMAERSPDHVIVVRLKTGDEIPLWAIASSGGTESVVDPEGRAAGLLAQLEGIRDPSTIRARSGAAGPSRRVRLPGLRGLGRTRSYVLVDEERIVPVSGGQPGRPIWRDAIDGMYRDRRPDPSVPRTSAQPAEDLSHVIVVRLTNGDEIPLWSVALPGGSTGRADAELRVDAVLAEIDVLPGPAWASSAAAKRSRRVRPPDHWAHVGYTAVWALPGFAVPYWLLGLPWWVGAIPAVFFVVGGLTETRTFLLVDHEQIVPVVNGVRGRPIPWDRIDSMTVAARPRPRWAPGNAAVSELGDPLPVVIARLRSGEEIPLWAAASIEDDAHADLQRRADNLLERLVTLQPATLRDRGAPPAPAVDASE